MTTIRDDRIALFAKLQDPATQPQFWDRVADDVDWTVEGTHPLAGRYHDKAQFIESTFARLAGKAVPGLPSDGRQRIVTDRRIAPPRSANPEHSCNSTSSG